MDTDLIGYQAWLEETRDDPLESMSGFFDNRVEDYEAHMARWERHYLWMAQLLPAGANCLLDLGCGTGLEIGPIFARFPNIQVTGIDLSPKMLEALCLKYSMRNLMLLCGDYFTLDLGDNQYDAAVSFETLHHFSMEKKTVLFQKILRALKPGAPYLECDYVAYSPQIESLAFAEAARRRARDGVPADTFVHFDTPLTPEHEMQSMRAAGFKPVELIGYLPGDNHTAMFRAIKPR